MDYKEMFQIEVAVAARQLQIARHRNNLFAICESMDIQGLTAFRIANGTYFSCNTNYLASGFGLTEEECQAINAEYDAISRLEQQIYKLRTTGNP